LIHHRRRALRLLALLASALPASPQDLFLRDATVIDMTGRAPYRASLLIRAGRIAAIGNRLAPPAGAEVLDLRGRYLLPGFADMHAHVTFPRGETPATYDRAVSEQVLRMLLAHGLTTVRNPAGPPVEAARLRDDVRAGLVPGSRILTAGTPLNGGTQMSGEAIAREVRRQVAAGADYIKVYSNSRPAQTKAAIDEAHRHGRQVIGHLQNTDWPEGAAMGIDFLTHAVSWSAAWLPEARRAAYAAERKRVGSTKARIFWLEAVEVDGPEVSRVIESLIRHRISVDPTLIAMKTKFVPSEEYRGVQNASLAPEPMRQTWVSGGYTADWSEADFARLRTVWPKPLAIVARYHRAGVLLTAGSDLPNEWVVPGISLHQELELLHEAGIPAADVLAMATRNAATARGLGGELGTVEAGKRADLVVLSADPLQSIRNTRAVEYVLSGGRLYRPAALWIPPR